MPESNNAFIQLRLVFGAVLLPILTVQYQAQHQEDGETEMFFPPLTEMTIQALTRAVQSYLYS